MADIKSVHILSDGTGQGTVVTDENGNKLPNLYSLTLEIEAAEINKVWLRCVGVAVDAEAEVKVTEFFCHLCNQVIEHHCISET